MKLFGFSLKTTTRIVDKATSVTGESSTMVDCRRAPRRVPLLMFIIAFCVAMIGSHLAATIVVDEKEIQARVRRAVSDLNSKNPDERLEATKVLRIWATYAVDEIHSISTAVITDEDEKVRMAAATVLEAMGSAAKNEACTLTRALSDSAPQVRSAAAFALGSIGSATDEARPALLKLLRERDPRTQLAAAYALRILFPETKIDFDKQALSSKSLLLNSLSRKEGSETIRLARALGSLDGRHALSVVPELVQLTNSSDPSLSANARYALKELGCHLVEFVPELLADAREGPLGARILAIDTLGWLQADSTEIISFLVENLGGPEPEVRIASCRSLGRMQSKAHPAIPPLMELVRGTSKESRRAAAYAILKISPKRVDDIILYLKNIDLQLAQELNRAQLESLF